MDCFLSIRGQSLPDDSLVKCCTLRKVGSCAIQTYTEGSNPSNSHFHLAGRYGVRRRLIRTAECLKCDH
jgi:hypothetical protein